MIELSETYTCPVCARTSHDSIDANNGYCGACHGYTSEDPPPGMRWVLFLGGGPLDRSGRLLVEDALVIGGMYETATGDARYVYDGHRFVKELAAA
jgi:hypothetical protein